MRQTETQIQDIYATTEEFLGDDVRVSLFHSRDEDHQWVGEIDQLIDLDQDQDNHL